MTFRQFLILFASGVAVSLAILIVFFSLFFRDIDSSFQTHMPDSAPQLEGVQDADELGPSSRFPAVALPEGQAPVLKLPGQPENAPKAITPPIEATMPEGAPLDDEAVAPKPAAVKQNNALPEETLPPSVVAPPVTSGATPPTPVGPAFGEE